MIRSLKIADLVGRAPNAESYYGQIAWHLNSIIRFLGDKALRPDIILVEALIEESGPRKTKWMKLGEVEKLAVIGTTDGDWHVELRTVQ